MKPLTAIAFLFVFAMAGHRQYRRGGTFTPTNAAAKTYGYQVPISAQVYDPLFPLWLCNVNLPTGLVTMGCLTGTSVGPGAPSITGVTIH